MKTLSLEQENPMDRLSDIAGTAALEAFTLKSIGNRIADILPTLAHSYRQYAYTHKSDKLDLTPLDVNRVILQKALSKANYLDIAKFAVVVPQGHEGNMFDFLEVFKNCLEFTNKIAERMTSYNQLLSALISSENVRSSTKDLSIATDKIEAQRVALKNSLARFAKINSRSDRKPLGDTYRSLGELEKTVALASEIMNMSIELDLASINKLINDSVELLDELERRALEGTIENISSQMYKSLASSTLTMARDAEFHALMCYKAYEIKSSMELTCKELIKALRY